MAALDIKHYKYKLYDIDDFVSDTCKCQNWINKLEGKEYLRSLKIDGLTCHLLISWIQT